MARSTSEKINSLEQNSTFITTNEFADYKNYINDYLENYRLCTTNGETQKQKYIESLEERLASLENQTECDKQMIAKQLLHTSDEQQIIDRLSQRQGKEVMVLNKNSKYPSEIIQNVSTSSSTSQKTSAEEHADDNSINGRDNNIHNKWNHVPSTSRLKQLSQHDFYGEKILSPNIYDYLTKVDIIETGVNNDGQNHEDNLT